MPFSSSHSKNRRTNLQNFMRSITPIVRSQPVPKSCVRDLNNLLETADKKIDEYFTLGDLWQSFDEWSAYGVGTPVVLNNGENVRQYYAPFLSGIQIYKNNFRTTDRKLREYADAVDSEVEFSSDDNGSHKSSKTWDYISRDSNTSLPITGDNIGKIYFEYYDTCSPYQRYPLLDKVTEFVQKYPELATAKSIDLSPASWMAVAWYPIYHIPTNGSMKNLSTCFLTFHTLSSHFQGTKEDYEDEEVLGGIVKRKRSGKISLPPFGLATLRMEGDVWIIPNTSDYEKLMSLHRAAQVWLEQLKVEHHDFNYFNRHSSTELTAH